VAIGAALRNKIGGSLKPEQQVGVLVLQAGDDRRGAESDHCREHTGAEHLPGSDQRWDATERYGRLWRMPGPGFARRRAPG
jgi:hypothetical protein